MNPLLTNKFKTLHGTVPFNQIKLEHFEPAIMEGMRLEDEAIQAIISNPEEPTFQNTIAPRTSELLDTATTIFFNLTSANTNDEMDALAQKLSPLLTEHANRIMLNQELFERVKHVYEHHAGYGNHLLPVLCGKVRFDHTDPHAVLTQSGTVR